MEDATLWHMHNRKPAICYWRLKHRLRLAIRRQLPMVEVTCEFPVPCTD